MHDSSAQPVPQPVVEYASPSTTKPSTRLLSLDVFRGLVILTMLLVNNLGDFGSTGYFWKHADWPAMSWGQAWTMWWGYTTHADWAEGRRAKLPSLIDDTALRTGRVQTVGPEPQQLKETERRIRLAQRELEFLMAEQRIADSPFLRIPLFWHCTLADYVMPMFMLIIGVAIPFSVAASISKGIPARTMWLRTIRRAGMLVLLGWILCYFRDQFAGSVYGKSPWTISLGMDVLQLLGVSYLVARLIYELPTKPRALLAGLLFIGHWALLRFYPQGDVPRGTFDEHFNSIAYIYSHWKSLHLGPVSLGFQGMLSVPPAAATMLIGSLVGDLLRSELSPRVKVKRMLLWGALMSAIGVGWAFDLPFNKPRWTPCYLLYVSGVGTMLLAIMYALIDVKQIRGWTYPLVVLGTNAIAVYFLSILTKVLLLNTPHVGGRPLIEWVMTTLKTSLGAWGGGWTFTILFIGFWWVIMDQFYRRKIFWKL